MLSTYTIYIIAALIVTIVTVVWIFTEQANNRRKVQNKILVRMNTLAGHEDSFLAKYQGKAVILPKSKQSYLKSVKGIDAEIDTYFADGNSTVAGKYPTPSGFFSFLSAECRVVSYVEGDPEPISKRVRKEKSIIGTPALLGVYRDSNVAAMAQAFDQELDKAKEQVIKALRKYINPWIVYGALIMNIIIFGVVIFLFLELTDGIKLIKMGLGV